MPRDLNRVTARLVAEGYEPLLRQLSLEPPTEQIELAFGSPIKAKRIQALLYDWLWFFPQIKAATTTRLNPETATL